MQNFTKFIAIGALGAAVLAGSVTGCRTSDGERTAGRVVDDRNITAQVESRLETEPVYKFQDVEVRTYNGLVQLSGFVTTQQQKQRAEQLASNVPGVARVVNNITLKPEGMPAATGRTNSVKYPQQQPDRQIDRDVDVDVDVDREPELNDRTQPQDQE